MSLRATISVVVPTAGGGHAEEAAPEERGGRGRGADDRVDGDAAEERHHRHRRRRHRRRAACAPHFASIRYMPIGMTLRSSLGGPSAVVLSSSGDFGMMMMLSRKGDVGPRVINTLVFRVKRGTWEQRAGRPTSRQMPFQYSVHPKI
jgi:hypothetical protein